MNPQILRTRELLHAPCTIFCNVLHRVAVRNPLNCNATHHPPLEGGAVLQWCGGFVAECAENYAVSVALANPW